MYSDVVGVQILVALLKKFNISHAVLSSGTCSIPVIHSLESDSYFNCYSDIDERSAVYFAIGISQAAKAPVAVVCTSGTAACNYLPGIVEAYYQKVPLVIITCDKNPYTLNHLTIQKVNQENIYQGNCKVSYTLPVIKDSLDKWACEIMINEALLELNHHGSGPVHLNIYTDGEKKTFSTPNLPCVKRINRYERYEIVTKQREIISKLLSFNRILVLFGESLPYDEKCVCDIRTFFEKYNCIISAEHMSNLHLKDKIITYPVLEQIDYGTFSADLMPDLVIYFNGNYSSYAIKSLLKKGKGRFSQWCINESGNVIDAWRGITDVFECSPREFFSTATSIQDCNHNNEEYYRKWISYVEKLRMPVVAHSNLNVARLLSSKLSSGDLVHLGILNSTRVLQYFKIPDKVNVYSNIGALGIDGSLSTFLGQAAVNTEHLSICLLGDLSFFYDINALYQINLLPNVRIILVNNGGGCEFHLNTGIKVIPMLDDYISAGHSSTAEKWFKECGMQYFCANSKEEFEQCFDDFLNPNLGCAAAFEVITDMEEEANAIKNLQTLNSSKRKKSINIQSMKKLLLKTIGAKKTEKVTRIIKIIKEQ